MPKRAPIPKCSDEDRSVLIEWSRSRTKEARTVERANIILRCLQGQSVGEVARELKVRPNTVIDWRRRFEREGLKGLEDRPRSGKPRRYNAEFRNQVLRTLELAPPPGQACWDGPAVAKHMETSVHAVWRLLRKKGICLSRQRSWCVSIDPEFTTKAAEIVGLYLNPPENALVISVDEKPSIQALERTTGYGCVCLAPARLFRANKSIDWPAIRVQSFRMPSGSEQHRSTAPCHQSIHQPARAD